MAMQSLEFSVNTAAILKEVATHFSNNPNNVPGIVQALNEIRIGLVRITARAIELHDEPLLKELQRLGCVKAS